MQVYWGWGNIRERDGEGELYIKDPAKRNKLIERAMSTSLSIFKKGKKKERKKERREGKEKLDPKEYIPYGYIYMKFK